MGMAMRCPECLKEMTDYGNMKECPSCRFTSHFDRSMAISDTIF